MTTPRPDPTLARRARLARLAELGQRVGYGMFGVAVVVFFYGAISGFVNGVVIVVVAAMGLGTVTLAPAIVLGYAVRAAEREDRERAATRRSPPP
jgi:hypothetical protein